MVSILVFYLQLYRNLHYQPLSVMVPEFIPQLIPSLTEADTPVGL
jgi:hypothetical protein